VSKVTRQTVTTQSTTPPDPRSRDTGRRDSGRRGRGRLSILIAATLTIGAGAVALPTGAQAAPAAVAAPSARLADPAADLALRARSLIAAGLAGDSRAMTRYAVVRNRLAEVVADRLGLDRRAMKRAWRQSSIAHQQAVVAALSQLGVPYRRFASVEGQGFDCSGLTSFAWAVAGHSLTRSSGTQIAAAESRSYDNAQAGDLVQYPGHVMMYLGVGDAVVHSPYTGRWVEVRRIGDRSVRLGDPIA
jgi:cell wall-associated NlpC family hydrolase